MTYTYDNPGRVLTTSNSGTSNIPTTVQTNVYDANSCRKQVKQEGQSATSRFNSITPTEWNELVERINPEADLK